MQLFFSSSKADSISSLVGYQKINRPPQRGSTRVSKAQRPIIAPRQRHLPSSATTKFQVSFPLDVAPPAPRCPHGIPLVPPRIVLPGKANPHFDFPPQVTRWESASRDPIVIHFGFRVSSGFWSRVGHWTAFLTRLSLLVAPAPPPGTSESRSYHLLSCFSPSCLLASSTPLGRVACHFSLAPRSSSSLLK